MQCPKTRLTWSILVFIKALWQKKVVKGKTEFSAGTKVVMNILLLRNGIYIKESICWAGSHTWFSFIPTCFYCELLGTLRWIITVSPEWSYQIADLLTSLLGHLWGFSATVRPEWALFHPCPGTSPPLSLSVRSQSLHTSLWSWQLCFLLCAGCWGEIPGLGALCCTVGPVTSWKGC